MANDLPREEEVTETKLPAINRHVFLQLTRPCKTWGILRLSKPVAVGGTVPIESGGDRMHQGWDQPTKQKQRDALRAFPGVPMCLKKQ